MRAWLLAVSMAANCAGCAVAQQQPVATQAPAIRYVLLDSAFIQFFANARDRQTGHSVLPDEEYVACVYGVLRGDSALVAFVRPTFSVPMGSAVVLYQLCPEIRGRVFGDLILLGTWHPHGPDTLYNGGCYFSGKDTDSFGRSGNLLEFVSCKQGVIWRGRDRETKEAIAMHAGGLN